MDGKILFVDDDPNLLGAYERQFRKHFRVLTALGPELGLEAIADGQFAVVVSDFRMPGMDGLAFLEHVHQVSPGTILILLSGNADLAEFDTMGKESHVFRFLNKPCSRDCLLACLGQAWDQYQRQLHATA